MRRISQMVMVLACWVVPVVAEEIPELKELQSKYEKAKAGVEKPLTDLQIRYLLKLGDLKATAQKKGDLEQVLAIEKEQKNFKAAKNEIPERFTALQEARTIYDNADRRIRGEISGSLNKLKGVYGEQLSKLQAQLTKAGRIEEAVTVRKLAEKSKGASGETLVPLEKGVLIGHWKFERNGDDSSGFRRHAKLMGAEVVEEGKVGTGALKTQIGKYAELPRDEVFDLDHPFTIALWIKPEKGAIQPQYAPFISKASGTWHLAVGGETNRPEFILNSNLGKIEIGEESNESKALVDGEWHHLVAVFDGQAASLHVDGRQVAVRKHGSKVSLTKTSQPVQIGGMADRGNRNFVGLIDDVRIYRKALGSPEIQRLASGAGLPGEK